MAVMAPSLHRHPYDETWLVVEGTVAFQAGDETSTAGPGDVVIVPADTPHKFTNEGPDPSRLVCISLNVRACPRRASRCSQCAASRARRLEDGRARRRS